MTVTELPVRHCRCGALQVDHAGTQHRGRGPNGCSRFRRDPAEDLWQRVQAAADASVAGDLTWADQRRPRSRVSEVMRGQGLVGVGPSDIGRCRKQVEYRERPPESYEPKPLLKTEAVVGTALHEAITKARRRRYPWRKYKLPVRVPGFDRPGEVDEYDPMLARVIDWKTRSERGWERLALNGPDDDDFAQAQVYGFGLIAAGHPVREVEIVYLRRSAQWPFEERYVRPYDEQAALRAIDWLHQVMDALEEGRSLPRDRMGPSVDTICARHCVAVDHCWQVKAAEAAGRSPEGWMLARDEPEVEQALRAYDEARRAGKPHRDRMKQIAAMLAGVEPGLYGSMRYGFTGGSAGREEVDWDAYGPQLVDLLREVAPERLMMLDRPTLTAGSRKASINVRPAKPSELAAAAKAEETG